jgi:hypothetical protein
MVMVVAMLMVVFVRTGRGIGLSTAGLAVVAAAALTKDDPARGVPGQFDQFLRQGHGLV